MSLDGERVLGNLPSTLRAELLAEYNEITRNFREGRWKAAELDGGRFCEVAYAIIKGYVDGNFPATASKPSNFPQACKDMEKVDKALFPQSLRITIPRVLAGLYEIRNNRNVGHVGGDVDANHMDATFVLHAVQWTLAELVRLFHATDTATATATVDALVDRTLPVVWKVGDVTRVLDTSLSLADQTMILVYGSTTGVEEKELARWLEQDRLGNYQRVTKRLHNARLVERSSSGLVTISPKGVRDVEERILPNLQL